MRARLMLLAPLRERDFRLLWTGLAISLLGDGIFLVALPWQVYQLSSSASAFALVGIAMSVPQIVLLLLGGVASDRFDRRRVMLAADLVRGLAVAGIGTLSITGRLELWHVMVAAAAFGAGSAFFGPAFDAVVPELVPPDLLPQANSLDQFVRPAAWRMLGPALGGWIIAWFGDRTGAAFLADAMTFGASVACLALMRARPFARSTRHEGSTWGDVREGFAYVRSQTWLWGTLLAASLAYLAFLGPTEVLLPRVVKLDMAGSASDLGFVLAMGGIGAMAAALVMSGRDAPRRHMTFIYLVWTGSTLCVAGYGLARLPWQAMAACFVFNALESAGTIVWMTTKQRLVPNRLLGRVSSLDWFISYALLPVSLALTGVVGGLVGDRATLIGAGVIGAVVTFAFLFLPGLRDVEGRAVTGEPAGAPSRDATVHAPAVGAAGPRPPDSAPSPIAASAAGAKDA